MWHWHLQYHMAAQRQNCINSVKGLFSFSLRSIHQKQKLLLFFRKQSQHFSLLHCVRATPKSKTLDAHKSKILTEGSMKEAVKVNSRLTGAIFLFPNMAEPQRGFSMTVPSANQLGMGKGKEADQEHAYQTSSASGEDDWVLRFANENGFLSWCRNSYLTTVVAIAMMAEGTTPLALQAAEGAFFVSGLNLTWGTYHYIYNLLRLRRKMGMSAVGALMYFSMAVLHLGLWFVVCTLFLGYTDETADSKLVGLEEKSAAEQGDDV
ncbi:transmembrane protein 160-like isoform X2 [Babylonia areolata]